MEKDRPGHYPAPLRSRQEPQLSPGRADNSGEFLAVAIGLSANALDACKTLLIAMPSGIGIVFFLVDNTGSLYNSTIVYLLATSDLITVRERPMDRQLSAIICMSFPRVSYAFRGGRCVSVLHRIDELSILLRLTITRVTRGCSMARRGM
jgi:hypothetical protein